MMLSRAKPAVQVAQKDGKAEKDKKLPELDDFLKVRDFTGALALLEINKQSGKDTVDTHLWIAYCAFHLGEYKRAMEEYEALLKTPKAAPDIWNYLACCQFMLGMYEQSEKSAKSGPKCGLQNRVLFHTAHKLGDEKRLMAYHEQLKDVLDDQLTLASIHFLRRHFQEAIDVFKRILLEKRELLALNAYVALCYYKLDFFDVSQEVLAVYLQHFPDSAIGINLKACNHYRLYSGKAAEAELRSFMESASPSFTFARDVLRHNMVVFRDGEGALQVLPSLVDAIPEARLNLVIYHLRQENINEAFSYMKDLEPTEPQEYILKGIVNAVLGQETNSREHIKLAQQFFQLVGSSASECDTIPGRQCMASCFFLIKQFSDALLYLNSIKSYFYNDDTFNFNYAQCKATLGQYKDAEEVFLLVQSEKLKRDYVYQSWLTRCFIMNGKPQQAWDQYLQMDTSAEAFSLLQLIANDCYRMGQFYYSAKAFDTLERLDPSPEYWEGKRGACCGVFQLVVAGLEARESLADVIHMLRTTANPQAESITRVIRKWAKDSGVPIPG